MKRTIDEYLYNTSDYYIGYEKPYDYCHDYTRRRGAETATEITNVSTNLIMEAYSDYRLSLEW